jgi:hypothetical protein
MAADSHLNRELVRALASADTRARFGTDRIEAGAGTAEDLAEGSTRVRHTDAMKRRIQERKG